MSAILSIAGADVAERVRRFAFIMTIVVALYGGYLYVPDSSAQYITVSIDGHRGIYNSAWMGAMIAALSAAFLTLVGFFLVRGSVERDRELRTDELVASSPVRKATFMLGKFGSNVTVLAAIAVVMYGATIVMQLLRAEDRTIDLLAYVLPLAIVTLPSLALVAAVAVLFDTLSFLRGVIGGVAYVVLWTVLLFVPITRTEGGTAWAPFDPLGTTVVTTSMSAGVRHAFARVNLHELEIGGSDVPAHGLTTFVFSGMHWSAALLATRFAWVVVALLIALAAVPIFDRFSGERVRPARAGGRLFDLAALVPNVTGLRLYRAELALLLNGSNIYWWIGAVALIIATGFASGPAVTKFVIPIALIWPIERWSELGCRDRRWNVEALLASAPRAFVRTALVQWTAGITVGAVICAGYLIRLIGSGHTGSALALIAAIAAISAAALACGVLTGTPRFFEGAYLIVWYLGPVNHLRQLDFATAAVVAPFRLIVVCAVVVLASLGAALLWRRIAHSDALPRLTGAAKPA